MRLECFMVRAQVVAAHDRWKTRFWKVRKVARILRDFVAHWGSSPTVREGVTEPGAIATGS